MNTSESRVSTPSLDAQPVDNDVHSTFVTQYINKMSCLQIVHIAQHNLARRCQLKKPDHFGGTCKSSTVRLLVHILATFFVLRHAYDALSDNRTSSVLSERDSLASTVCRMLKRKRNNDLPLKEDFNLNMYPSRDGSRKFVMCAYPKTGCSQWIMLLHYLWTGEKLSLAGHDFEHIHRTGARLYSMATVKSAGIRSLDVPRILIMRNPYERTISAYHDFKRRNDDRDITFEKFMFDNVNRTSRSKQPIDHRMPISMGCSSSTWMHGGWDYVFQLEQMSLWLPCLLRELNLTHVVASGWDDGSLFHVPKFSCHEMLQVALVGGDAKSVKAFKTGHESPKDDLHTAATIDIVHRVFHNDFVIGGYKLRY